MTLPEKISEGIKEAMKSRDPIRLNTLRMLKSKILAVDARGNLPDSEVIKLFKTYYGNLQEALEQAEAANRTEAAQELKAELSIIQEFLPKALSPEETKKLVEQAITESGAKSKKDVGLVMRSLMKLNNAVDGKLAKQLIDQLLGDA
ncbi:MAG: GatB/YqeY domain-containing protein [Verrucomicrobia bacterium]|nr:GatB/YqeY domain-containing protein [Verrucomicrobiota bacterium]